MVKSLRIRVYFSHPTGHYVWKFLLGQILGAPLRAPLGSGESYILLGGRGYRSLCDLTNHWTVFQIPTPFDRPVREPPKIVWNLTYRSLMTSQVRSNSKCPLRGRVVKSTGLRCWCRCRWETSSSPGAGGHTLRLRRYNGVRVCGRSRTEAREREWAEGTVSTCPVYRAR